MKKYVFKPYSKNFPELFQKEKERIVSNLNLPLVIEHIGSTAVPGLGGKGIIDIGIATDRRIWSSYRKNFKLSDMSLKQILARQIGFTSLLTYPIRKKAREDTMFI
jgi:GrpB-like predicted nucleotidyltransferase (UPF0157 family)